MAPALDIPSLLLASAAVTLALALAMLAVRAALRTYPGFGLWVGGACAASASVALVARQGFAHPALTVLLGNTCMALYPALTAAGLERFLGLPPRWKAHAAGVAAVTLVALALGVLHPAVTLRIVLISLVLAAWLARSAALVLRHAPRVLGAPSRLAPAALAAFAAWHLSRAALLAGRSDAVNAVPANDPAQALLFAAFPALFVLVALGLLALDLQRAERDLRESVEALRVLRGIVPICAGCKQIRDGETWTPVEAWVGARSQAEFSHGLCPACAERMYPGL